MPSLFNTIAVAIPVLFTIAWCSAEPPGKVGPASPEGVHLYNFDQDKPGEAPAGFTTALTGGGKPGHWVVKVEPTAPSGKQVVVQTDGDPTGYRFPLLIAEKPIARDVEVAVRFKPISGEQDQGAGVVWRYRDKDNYYLVRANALEDNVVLYKVEKGKRTDLPVKGKGRTYGVKTKVASGKWSSLRIVAIGNLFEIYLDDKKLFEGEDETFKDAGLAGVWTKADSVIAFDDLRITTLDKKWPIAGAIGGIGNSPFLEADHVDSIGHGGHGVHRRLFDRAGRGRARGRREAHRGSFQEQAHARGRHQASLREGPRSRALGEIRVR